MKKCLAAATVYLCIFSPVSLAEFYVGTGVGYQVIDTDQISSLGTAPRAVFVPPASLGDVELPDLYPDEFTGIQLVSGYKLGPSVSFEIGYFNSSTERYKQTIGVGSVESASAEIGIESLSFDVLGHYQLNDMNSVSFVGSAGFIYQEIDITREYQLIVTCVIDSNSECNGRRKERAKENAYDTRLQLGAGIQYDVNDRLGMRTMVKVVPDGFSIGEDFPYTISASLLYSF